MPTLPLYSHPTHPNAWHQVRSPGGYEWWHFDADDVEQDLQVIARFFDGHPFDPDYRRRYRRYRRRPTRVTPPVPGEYTAAQVAVYRRGGREGHFLRRYPREQFAARSDGPEVHIGPNQFSEDGSSLRVAFTDEQLRGELCFSRCPAHAPGEHELMSRALAGAEQRWIIAAPLCDVAGDLIVAGRSVTFRGRGYHDHFFGAGPVVRGVAGWMRGRLLLPDRTIAFVFARRDDWRGEDELHLIETDAAGSREIEVAHTEIDWPKRSTHPGSVRFADVLELSEARPLEAPSSLTPIMYAAHARGSRGRALCEIYLPR